MVKFSISGYVAAYCIIITFAMLLEAQEKTVPAPLPPPQVTREESLELDNLKLESSNLDLQIQLAKLQLNSKIQDYSARVLKAHPKDNMKFDQQSMKWVNAKRE